MHVLQNTALLKNPHMVSTKCFSRPSPLNAFFSYFLMKKVLLFFFLLTMSNFCCSWSFVLIELENQCITHVNLLLLVLTSLNRSLAKSPAFHLYWVCSFNAEAVSFLFFLLLFFFIASILDSLVW